MESKSTIQIFNPDELSKNESVKEQLFKLVGSGEAILFVGSGLSIPVGFPSWDELLLKLERLAEGVGSGFSPNPTDRQADPLTYADRIKEHFKNNECVDRYCNELHNIFSRKKPNYKEFHKKLVKLPFGLILTTNYDTVLSDALSRVFIEEEKTDFDGDLCFAMNDETKPLLSKSLLSLHKSMNFQKKIAHLHGYYLRQNEIILTKNDYEKCYFGTGANGKNSNDEQTLHFLVLWSLMATRRIVFFGFGMKDPYLIQLLEGVSKKLWRWDRPTHINVAGITAENAAEAKEHADSLRERFGVDTYFYENIDRTHFQLETLIDELFESCGGVNGPKKDFQHHSAYDSAMDKRSSTSWIKKTNSRLNSGLDNENR